MVRLDPFVFQLPLQSFAFISVTFGKDVCCPGFQ